MSNMLLVLSPSSDMIRGGYASLVTHCAICDTSTPADRSASLPTLSVVSPGQSPLRLRLPLSLTMTFFTWRLHLDWADLEYLELYPG